MSKTLTTYTSHSPYIDMQQVMLSASYQAVPYADANYYGQINNLKRSGYGAMDYTNGRYYEGQWHNDLRHGKGYEHYSNHNTYEGEYREGRPQGKGIYKWANGEIFDGEWLNGLKHGDGVWKGTHGDSYIGEWKNSKADGYGVHIWANGDRYEGEWKECLKNGNGTDIFANGDMYIGQYKDGKPNGNGQYIWKIGSTYSGEFKNGLKHGQGKWKKTKDTNCHSFEGQYFNDKKEGFGIFKWASGNIYRGMFQCDEREGIGEMRWTDGSVYLGQWHKGIQHGYGKMIFPDGGIKEGFFDNNIFKEKHRISKIDIPEQLLDSKFSISNLDPMKRKLANSKPIYPLTTKFNTSMKIDRRMLNHSLRRREKIVEIAKHSILRVNKPIICEYHTTKVNGDRSHSSSKSNVSVDSSLRKPSTTDDSFRNAPIRKKRRYYLPSVAGSNLSYSFNCRDSRSKLILNKRKEKTKNKLY